MESQQYNLHQEIAQLRFHNAQLQGEIQSTMIDYNEEKARVLALEGELEMCRGQSNHR